MKRFYTFALFLGICPIMVCSQSANKPHAWLTTGDSTVLFQQVANVKHSNPGNAETIAINPAKSFQQIDGFGYALTQGSAMHMINMSPSSRSALLHQLFDTTGNGIGVSYLRLSIGASDLNEKIFSYDDVAGDTALKYFDIAQDRKDVLPVLKEILHINPRITIMASPWSPPAWMKTNNDTRGGQLKPVYYQAYARYFEKYLAAMAQEGIKISAITVQNEPLHPGNNPSLLMTAPEQADFIGNHLGPLFRKNRIETKIIVYDHNCNRPDYPLFILNDVVASQYVDGSGFHLYEGTTDSAGYVHDQHPDKNIYFTEQCVVQFNEKRKAGEPRLNVSGIVSELLIGATRNWSKNVLQWNLASNPAMTPFTDRGGCGMCQGAVTIDGNNTSRNLAWYTMAHFSKFVRPGAMRIASNIVDNLPNVAFKNTDGTIVLVVANTSNKPASFNVELNAVTSSFVLPAQSVVTYVF